MTKNPLRALLESLATREGKRPSGLPGVDILRFDSSIPRCPVVYEPSIVFVALGRKIGFLGGQAHVYDADHYLVLSIPLPFECETQGPLLGLSVGVEPTLLGELLLLMDDCAACDNVPGMASTLLTEDLSCAVLRLAEALAHPSDRKILGPQVVREIVYRVLRGPQGSALRAVATRNSQFSQIARALAKIHTDYAQHLDVVDLAEEANMSVSAFHQKFKVITANSPLQYLKSIRLHKARMLIMHDGLNASAAARTVGYESPSQFSREFKRLFGSSPKRC